MCGLGVWEEIWAALSGPKPSPPLTPVFSSSSPALEAEVGCEVQGMNAGGCVDSQCLQTWGDSLVVYF